MKENIPQPITPESFGEVPDYFEPQTGRYLVRNSSLRWVALNETCYKRQLRSRGQKFTPEDGELLSEIDTAILEVQDQRDVSHYGPSAGRTPGFSA